MSAKEAKTAAKTTKQAKPMKWTMGILKSGNLTWDSQESEDLTGDISINSPCEDKSTKSDVGPIDDEPRTQKDEPPIEEIIYEQFVEINDVAMHQMLTAKLASRE